MHDNLGAMLVELGRFDEAMEHYAAAARLDPADWRAPYLRGKALLKQGRDLEAIPYFRQAMQIDPDNLHVLIYLAQVLASDENPKVRDGHTAFALASRANTLTGGAGTGHARCIGHGLCRTWAFDDAQKAAQEALNLAKAVARRMMRSSFSSDCSFIKTISPAANPLIHQPPAPEPATKLTGISVLAAAKIAYKEPDVSSASHSACCSRSSRCWLICRRRATCLWIMTIRITSRKIPSSKKG